MISLWSMMSKNWEHIRIFLFLLFLCICLVLCQAILMLICFISRLVCTALYNGGDGERKYLPQFFKFTVSNPLSVRTKVTGYLFLCVSLNYDPMVDRTNRLSTQASHISNWCTPFFFFSGSHHQGRLHLVLQFQTVICKSFDYV
jgi:low affinity Fe/Cu permease